MLRVIDNISCDLGMVKDKIMYFLVNLAPPKPFNLATLIVAGA